MPPSSLPADSFMGKNSRPPSPAIECFEDLSPEELAKIEEAQAKGRKPSAWKNFNFKKQLSRAEMKIKSTFKEGGGTTNPNRKQSTFYTDGAQLSPVETSPNSESNSTPTSPDTEQREFLPKSETDTGDNTGGTATPVTSQQPPAVAAVSAAFELVTKNLEDLAKRPEAGDCVGDENKTESDFDTESNSPNTETEERVPEPATATTSQASQSKKVDFVEEVMVKSTHTNVEGAFMSRPSDLPLDDVPIRPPRTKKFFDKRAERLLSVPNLKLTKLESNKLKDLRSKSTKTDPSSFTGNLMRRFSKYQLYTKLLLLLIID